jgi:hypothetical protein|tara:strand:- start:187 stop:516 length:330 start_codon:yes stop_codon:yes gene_type:complete
MAQDFEAIYQKDIMSGSYTTSSTHNSDDTIIGLRFANKHSGSVTVDARITRSAIDYYLIKDAPVPGGGSLELVDGGAKIVVQNGDVMMFRASRTGSVDVLMSYIDAIST